MSWEGNTTDAAIANGPIPEQSIRLRVLANSDSPEDQWLKREVRDEIIEAMKSYVGDISDVKQAREIMGKHLPEINEMVQKAVYDRGFTYKTDVVLGQVEFPTKMYGDYVYPAGNYEALRVTIGEGLGQNWWCVLFPPLCFVDMANGEAVNPDEGNVPEQGQQQVKVKFFLIEWISNIFDKVFN